LGSSIPSAFGADFVSFVKPEDNTMWERTSLSDKNIWEEIKSEISDAIIQVSETGFLATEKIQVSVDYSLVLVPIQEGRKQTMVMVIGYNTSFSLSKKLLNLYLGIAGLIGNIISRISYEEELRSSSARLEELVNERTFRLKAANTELAEVNRKLREMSAIDGLTGIANRRYFDQYLSKRCLEAARKKQPLAIIMMDIDYFKIYNDTYGHQAGDNCLKKVAEALKANLLRPLDLVARFGGEEFIGALPDTDLDGARKVAERLRTEVEKLKLHHKGSQVSRFVTISIGVCAAAHGESFLPKELVRVADEALYKVKNAGRNQVVVVDYKSE